MCDRSNASQEVGNACLIRVEISVEVIDNMTEFRVGQATFFAIALVEGQDLTGTVGIVSWQTIGSAQMSTKGTKKEKLEQLARAVGANRRPQRRPQGLC